MEEQPRPEKLIHFYDELTENQAGKFKMPFFFHSLRYLEMAKQLCLFSYRNKCLQGLSHQMGHERVERCRKLLFYV